MSVVTAVEVFGAKDYGRLARKLGALAGPLLKEAATVEAERVINIGSRLAPRDTGRLRASGWVGERGVKRRYRQAGSLSLPGGRSTTQYELGVSSFSVEFGFGRDDASSASMRAGGFGLSGTPNAGMSARRLAPTSAYALIQHEALHFRHRYGGAQYLTRAVAENRRGQKERMSRRVRAGWEQRAR